MTYKVPLATLSDDHSINERESFIMMDSQRVLNMKTADVEDPSIDVDETPLDGTLP